MMITDLEGMWQDPTGQTILLVAVALEVIGEFIL